MLLVNLLGRHGLAISLLLGCLLLAVNGALGESYGFYHLFRLDGGGDDDTLLGWDVIQSRPFLTGFHISYLFSFVYCISLEQFAVDRVRQAGNWGWLCADPNPPSVLIVVASFLPFVFLSIAAYMFPLVPDVPAPSSKEAHLHAAGALAGALPASLIMLTATGAACDWKIMATRSGALLFAPRVRLVGLLAMMLVINVAFDATYSFASVINIVGWGLLAYFAWLELMPGLRAVGLVLLALYTTLPSLRNSSRFGDDDWRSAVASPVQIASNPRHASSHEAGGGAAGLVKPVDALRSWSSLSQAAERPKLVILAASGGGYRATIWTAHVLDRLKSESGTNGRLPGLIDSVRLVTGASGGMVANAYFIAQQQEACGASRGTALVQQIKQDIARYYASLGYPRQLGNDSLSAIARQWVKADFLGIGPGRAKVLEEQWSSLCSTMRELQQVEREGRAPSFIIAPTMVEDGRPVFISNLDLGDIASHAFGAIPGDAANGGAWDFSRLFPAGHLLLKLQTAVRFSASFPYVTPAEILPTQPRRRLVDAGFSDNYGVMSAIAYLSNAGVRQWIREKNARVFIVEVWSHPHDGSSRPCLTADSKPALSGSQMLDGLTEPIEAVFSARESSMIVRNQQLIRNLATSYSNDAINHFLIDNQVSASLSWYLPEREIGCLTSGRADKALSESFHRLSEIWNLK